jgi:hypothetical protein
MTIPDPPPLFTIGVITDTHIPDRVPELNPRFLAFFQQAQVDAIYHAGDISSPNVLIQLEQVAPVTAVRGNRDLRLNSRLPLIQERTVAGIDIALTHGHGGWGPYLVDKVKYMIRGYEYERYRDWLLGALPRARIIIFGHTHHNEQRWEGEQFLFNPGAAYPCPYNKFHPTLGLLSIYPNQKFEARVIPF